MSRYPWKRCKVKEGNLVRRATFVEWLLKDKRISLTLYVTGYGAGVSALMTLLIRGVEKWTQ